jgi:hypothetical protein
MGFNYASYLKDYNSKSIFRKNEELVDLVINFQESDLLTDATFIIR